MIRFILADVFFERGKKQWRQSSLRIMDSATRCSITPPLNLTLSQRLAARIFETKCEISSFAASCASVLNGFFAAGSSAFAAVVAVSTGMRR